MSKMPLSIVAAFAEVQRATYVFVACDLPKLCQRVMNPPASERQLDAGIQQLFNPDPVWASQEEAEADWLTRGF